MRSKTLVKAESEAGKRRAELKEADEVLSEAKGKLAVAQAARDDINKATAAKIEQVLDLHAALVGRLAEAAVEAAGATAPKIPN